MFNGFFDCHMSGFPAEQHSKNNYSFRLKKALPFEVIFLFSFAPEFCDRSMTVSSLGKIAKPATSIRNSHHSASQLA